MGVIAVLLETARLVWLVVVIATSVWLPAAIKHRTLRPPAARLFEQAVMTALFVALAVAVLASLRLLNPLTLLLAAPAPGLALWLLDHRGAIAADALQLGRWMIWRAAVFAESASHLSAQLPWRRPGARAITGAAIRQLAPHLLTAMLMAVIAAAIVAPRVLPALTNTRLSDASAYGELLTVQRLLAGEAAWPPPTAFASIAAALSLMSSIAAVHVVRLLVPLVQIASLVVLMLSVRQITAAYAPAVVAVAIAWLLGPLQQRPPSLHFADLSALLLLLFVRRWPGTGRRHLWAAGGCAVLAATSAPATVPLLAIIAMWVLLKPEWLLPGTGAAWLAWWWLTGSVEPAGGSLVPNAAVNAAVAAALLAAGIVQHVAVTFRWQRATHRLATAAAAAMMVFLSAVPRIDGAQYVEYDAAARQTLAIAAAFPKYRFMIVGPLEQWALSYGRAWHMNLHEFVTIARSSDLSGRARLPFHVDELFVFVETRPFATFPVEPVHVPFTTLTDPVFRYYRSLAGRSSLQFEAYELCERLRASHGGSVYFDDGRLRIYRFSTR